MCKHFFPFYYYCTIEIFAMLETHLKMNYRESSLYEFHLYEIFLF